jgi:hypothetical protein
MPLGVLLTTQAHAEERGWRLSVERVAGFDYTSLSTRASSASASDVSNEMWSLNLLGSTLATRGSLWSALTVPSPRLALDYEFRSHLTVGLAATLQLTSVEEPSLRSAISTFGFGLAPRVGYSMRLSDKVTFWPRAGVTFARYSISARSLGSSSGSSTETTLTELSVNLEPTLVFTPIEHVGLLLTVCGDIPLVGDVTTGSRDGIQRRALTVGLQFGVQVRF